jgi:hypothetical protein
MRPHRSEYDRLTTARATTQQPLLCNASPVLARKPAVFTNALSFPNSGGFACLAALRLEQELRLSISPWQIGLGFQLLKTVQS